MAFSRTSAVQPRVLDLNERLREISKLLRPLLGDDIEILMVPRSPSAVVEVEALRICMCQTPVTAYTTPTR